eukprot:g6998.t1
MGKKRRLEPQKPNRHPHNALSVRCSPGRPAQSFTSQQIDPLARFRKQPTVVPDAASRADPPPAVPPVLDVNNVARFKRATAADNVNIPTIASDPLARFKRQRKSESSSISSSHQRLQLLSAAAVAIA